MTMNEKAKGFSGRCLCGAVTVESSAEPQAVFHCCCEDCRRSSGTGHCTHIVIPESAFSLTGDVTFFAHKADSGNTVTKAFCGTCGSPIYATSAEGGPKVYGIRLGTVRQRRDLVPARQYWTASALPWLGALDGIDKVSGNTRRPAPKQGDSNG